MGLTMDYGITDRPTLANNTSLALKAGLQLCNLISIQKALCIHVTVPGHVKCPYFQPLG